MLLLTPEQHRILRNRIVVALELARYFPAETRDVVAVADKVLRYPLTPQEHNSGRKNEEAGS